MKRTKWTHNEILELVRSEINKSEWKAFLDNLGKGDKVKYEGLTYTVKYVDRSTETEAWSFALQSTIRGIPKICHVDLSIGDQVKKVRWFYDNVEPFEIVRETKKRK